MSVATTFSFSIEFNRRLVYSMAMTASDLCVSAKPWDVQIDPVKSIFEEFYAQVRCKAMVLYGSVSVFNHHCVPLDAFRVSTY